MQARLDLQSVQAFQERRNLPSQSQDVLPHHAMVRCHALPIDLNWYKFAAHLRSFHLFNIRARFRFACLLILQSARIVPGGFKIVFELFRIPAIARQQIVFPMLGLWHPGPHEKLHLAIGASEFLRHGFYIHELFRIFFCHFQNETEMGLKSLYASHPPRPPSPAVFYLPKVP
jgi:hypothetical protein